MSISKIDQQYIDGNSQDKHTFGHYRDRGLTKLMRYITIHKKYPHIIKVLPSIIASTNINAQSRKGWTALLIACNTHLLDYNIIKILLEKGADPNISLSEKLSFMNCFNILSTDLCNTLNINPIIKLLIQYQYNPNISDLNGFTILNNLCKSKYKYASECIITLLEAGANPNIIDKYGGNCLFDIMENTPNLNIFKTLLYAGCDATLIKNGTSLIHIDKYIKSFSEINTLTEVVTILLEFGINPNIQDRNGNTILHMICSSNFPSPKKNILLQLVLSKGGDPYIPNNNGLKAVQMISDIMHINFALFNLLNNNKNKLDLLKCLVSCSITNYNGYITTIIDEITNYEIADEHGNSIIHIICKNINSIHTLTHILSKGVPLNYINNNGETCLNYVCNMGFADHVELLLKYGADSSVGRNMSRTLSTVEDIVTRDKIIDSLLKYGNKSEITELFQYFITANQITTPNISILIKLFSLLDKDKDIAKGQQLVKYILEKCQQFYIISPILTTLSKEYFDYVCLGILFRKTNIPEILPTINLVCDKIDFLNDAEIIELLKTLCINMCRNGINDVSMLAIIDNMNKYGININTRLTAEGNTLVHELCKRGGVQLVKYLVEKLHGNLNEANLNGYNSLHIAVGAGNAKIIPYLLDNIENVEAKINSGKTCLELVYSDDILHLILTRINPNMILSTKNSIIEFVEGRFGLNSIVQIISILLDRGLVVNARNQLDILKHLVLSNNFNVAEPLIDIILQRVDLTNVTFFGNNTLLGLLCAHDNANVQVIKKLVSTGLNVNSVNINGDNCVHILCKNRAVTSINKLEIIEYLINSGIDIQVVNSHGSNYLQLLLTNCCFDSNVELVMEYLINKGLSVNDLAPNYSGGTVLHIVLYRLTCSGKSSSCISKILEMLVKYGIDCNIKDIKGKTALSFINDEYKDAVKRMLRLPMFDYPEQYDIQVDSCPVPECLICQSNIPVYVGEKCCHLLYCQDCKSRVETNKCPICRISNKSYYRVFY
jgi:ankyrin repeat protein